MSAARRKGTACESVVAAYLQANGLARPGDFGPYTSAIARWEAILGRPAPPPTRTDPRTGRERLNPGFVEWMMGLPPGWVTGPDIGLSDAQQLKALGNGVVPQQAALALTYLLEAE